jgi:hypothetical protein
VLISFWSLYSGYDRSHFDLLADGDVELSEYTVGRGADDVLHLHSL